MKQTPLFDDFFSEMPEPLEKPLWLNEPSQHRWLEVTQLLNDHCTKQLMLTYAACFQSWLSQYTKVYITNQDGGLRNADELILMTKTNTPKQQIAYGLAVIFSDDQNLSAYLSSISPELRLLLQAVITNIYVLHSDAKHIMHSTEDLFRQQRTGYYYSNEYTPRDPALGWMELRTYYAPLSDIHHYRERANYLTMNNTVRALFMPHLLPEAYRSNSSLPSLPEDTDYNVIDMEASSHAHFRLIAGLMEQGELPIKKNGVSVADMKRVLKKVAMEEFFPGATNQYHQNMRSYAYLQLLALHHSFIKKGKTAMSYEDTLRDLISNFRTINYYLTSLLYPHVTGMRRQFSDYGKQDKLCMLLLDLMKEQPDEWYSPNDVMLKILALEDTTISAHYSILVFYPPYEEYNNNLTNDYSGRSITVDRYTQEFGYTGLQSFAMLMASLGIFQVALNLKDKRKLSPYDSVDYIRLTPLGRYALGLTDDYEPPQLEHTAYFELDPDRLIIRSLTQPNPYEQLLSDTSTPISKNRFETSATSFLANCSSRSDVENKISTFRQFIASDLPPLWEQFFNQLLQHIHPLHEDITPYKHFTLQSDDHELISLITTDPVLRQIVIRAEGYRIMVLSTDMKKFTDRMKKHGYLL